MGVSRSDSEIESVIVEAMDNSEVGNTYLSTLVYIEKQEDEKKATMIMENNEDLKLSFEYGGYNINNQYENAVIIGTTLEKYVIDEGGKKYIYIDDNKLNVIGILENNMSGGIDTSLYVFWDTLEEGIRKYYLEEGNGFNNIYIRTDKKYNIGILQHFFRKIVKIRCTACKA